MPTEQSKRATLNHADVFTLSSVFTKAEVEEPGSGLKSACAAFPEHPKALIEKKLRTIGALTLTSDDHVLAGETLAAIRALPYPWLVAEHLAAKLGELVAEHAKATG
jgi:hypothetical protein